MRLTLLALATLVSTLLSAQQERHFIFDYMEQGVKSIRIVDKGTIDYFYQPGLVVTQSDFKDLRMETRYHYSQPDRIDSILYRPADETAYTVEHYYYNQDGQLISTWHGQDLLQDKVEVDSFFYNTQGQLTEIRSYTNKLGVEHGYRRVDHLILGASHQLQYNTNGQNHLTKTEGWVFPYDTRYTYDSAGRVAASEKMMYEQEDGKLLNSGILIATTYTYADNGLLLKSVSQTAKVKANGRRKALGQVYFKRRISYY